MSLAKRVAGVVAMVGFVGAAAPVSTHADAVDTNLLACSAENSMLPSCKPHSGWYCFHDGMLEPIFNFCDPNDTNCWSTAGRRVCSRSLMYPCLASGPPSHGGIA